MNFNKMFKMNKYIIKPKDSYDTLVKLQNKKLNSFENLKESRLSLNYLDQSSYVIQTNDFKSVESFFFSITHDSTGYYLSDSKSIKHFHNKYNCLKYKMANIMKAMNYDNVQYRCYEFNNINNSTEEFDYVNNAYMYGKRIYIK